MVLLKRTVLNPSPQTILPKPVQAKIMELIELREQKWTSTSPSQEKFFRRYSANDLFESSSISDESDSLSTSTSGQDDPSDAIVQYADIRMAKLGKVFTTSGERVKTIEELTGCKLQHVPTVSEGDITKRQIKISGMDQQSVTKACNLIKKVAAAANNIHIKSILEKAAQQDNTSPPTVTITKRRIADNLSQVQPPPVTPTKDTPPTPLSPPFSPHAPEFVPANITPANITAPIKITAPQVPTPAPAIGPIKAPDSSSIAALLHTRAGHHVHHPIPIVAPPKETAHTSSQTDPIPEPPPHVCPPPVTPPPPSISPPSKTPPKFTVMTKRGDINMYGDNPDLVREAMDLLQYHFNKPIGGPMAFERSMSMGHAYGGGGDTNSRHMFRSHPTDDFIRVSAVRKNQPIRRRYERAQLIAISSDRRCKEPPEWSRLPNDVYFNVCCLATPNFYDPDMAPLTSDLAFPRPNRTSRPPDQNQNRPARTGFGNPPPDSRFRPKSGNDINPPTVKKPTRMSLDETTTQNMPNDMNDPHPKMTRSKSYEHGAGGDAGGDTFSTNRNDYNMSNSVNATKPDDNPTRDQQESNDNFNIREDFNLSDLSLDTLIALKKAIDDAKINWDDKSETILTNENGDIGASNETSIKSPVDNDLTPRPSSANESDIHIVKNGKSCDQTAMQSPAISSTTSGIDNTIEHKVESKLENTLPENKNNSAENHVMENDDNVVVKNDIDAKNVSGVVNMITVSTSSHSIAQAHSCVLSPTADIISQSAGVRQTAFSENGVLQTDVTSQSESVEGSYSSGSLVSTKTEVSHRQSTDDLISKIVSESYSSPNMNNNNVSTMVPQSSQPVVYNSIPTPVVYNPISIAAKPCQTEADSSTETVTIAPAKFTPSWTPRSVYSLSSHNTSQSNSQSDITSDKDTSTSSMYPRNHLIAKKVNNDNLEIEPSFATMQSKSLFSENPTSKSSTATVQTRIKRNPLSSFNRPENQLLNVKTTYLPNQNPITIATNLNSDDMLTPKSPPMSVNTQAVISPRPPILSMTAPSDRKVLFGQANPFTISTRLIRPVVETPPPGGIELPRENAPVSPTSTESFGSERWSE